MFRIFAASGELCLPERHRLPLFDPRVHVIDSLRARLPSLIAAFFRQSSCLSPLLSFFPFRSRFVSRAVYAPHLVSLQKNPRFISLRTIPASISLPLFYPTPSPLSLRLRPALARTFSPFLFHPIHPHLVHFLSLSPSRFNHRTSVFCFCFSDPFSAIVFLSLSQTPRECLSSTSLFTPCHLPPTIVLCCFPLSTSLSMLCLFLSFSR